MQHGATQATQNWKRRIWQWGRRGKWGNTGQHEATRGNTGRPKLKSGGKVESASEAAGANKAPRGNTGQHGPPKIEIRRKS